MDQRSGDRLVPVPEPHLKSMPSVLARVRMRVERIVYRVDEAGRALRIAVAGRHRARRLDSGFQCQFCASELGSMRSQPTLNHTGELNAAFWLQQQVGKLVVEDGRVVVGCGSSRR